jgi:hypothetical protein
MGIEGSPQGEGTQDPGRAEADHEFDTGVGERISASG